MLFLVLLGNCLSPASRALAQPPLANPAQSSQVSAYELIIAMNTLRLSNGLPALKEDPIIDAVAQSTAEIMAANQMSSHIGNVSGRLAAAGYGGGAKVWATENFAVGDMGIDEIMLVWSDAAHMIPAVTPAYCNIGAGVAKSSNGRTYYVLQAAYTTAKSCGEYKSPGGNPGGSSGNTNAGNDIGVPQWIVPVKVATPDKDGKVFHVVQQGQSFWSIAIAYKITIKDLEIWNNLSRDSKLQVGQRLFIPSSNTAGYSTPTPVGMVQVSAPDANGKIVHTVQAYQTLSTIAQAYKVNIDAILALNGWQIDWPLQIGQKLLIYPGSVTPSPTPNPLTPLQKLTPASDGKYYHTVQSGETLSWIAQLYEISVTDLMAWNGLDGSSIIHPDEKLVLLVTPPATETPTPDPATATATVTPLLPTHTPTPQQTQPDASPTATTITAQSVPQSALVWVISLGLAVSGLFLFIFFARKRQ